VSAQAIALLSMAALFAGTVDAIAGGGGLVTLPALMYAGLPPDLAIATNKGQSVWGSTAAAIAFWRAGRVDKRMALALFPLALAGGVAGSRLLLELSNEALRPIVLVMLVGAAIVLVVNKPTGTETSPRRPLVAALVAVAIGTYDGFFGPGTGTFLIVSFVTWCGRNLVDASADAKVVNVASNIGALTTLVLADRVVWSVALPMAAASCIGGVLGARVAMAGGTRVVRMAVVVVSGALVARLVYQLIA
jgi:hypothetical protein